MEKIRIYKFLIILIASVLYVVSYVNAEFAVYENDIQIEDWSTSDEDGSEEERETYDIDEKEEKQHIESSSLDSYSFIFTPLSSKKAVSLLPMVPFQVSQGDIPTPPPEK